MRGAGLYGLALQVIGLPVAALLIGRALGIAPHDGMGLTLAALAPASAASHGLVGLAGGHVGLARTLTLWSTLTWLPVTALLGMGSVMPAIWIVALLGMVLPLAAGLLIGHRDRGQAARLERRCSLLGSAMIGLLLVLTFLRHWLFIADWRLWLTVFLLAGLATAAGLSGRVFGRAAAPTLAITTPMQNIALPLVIAAIGDVDLPVAIYALAMYCWAALVLALSRRLR